ncbi:MAG TPA: hypothetical protein VH541_06140, partial [Gaiellaceae bacterium]
MATTRAGEAATSELAERAGEKVQHAVEKELEARVTRQSDVLAAVARNARCARQPDLERAAAGEQPEPPEARSVEASSSPRSRDSGEPAEPTLTDRDAHKSGRPLRLDSVVISLAAKGLANAQISQHLREVYNETVSAQAVARITDRVLD